MQSQYKVLLNKQNHFISTGLCGKYVDSENVSAIRTRNMFSLLQFYLFFKIPPIFILSLYIASY